MYKERNLEEFSEEHHSILNKNGLKFLLQWKKLTPESKKKYPDGLVSILDEAAQIETKALNEPWQKQLKKQTMQMN